MTPSSGPTEDGIQLGIVTVHIDAMTTFYRDVVGLEDLGAAPTRSTPGGWVRTLRCGSSLLKLVSYAQPPSAAAPGGGVRAATGYRYWTLTVADLEGMLAACERAGSRVVVPRKHLGGGIEVAIVEDPDGNWVEFMRER